MEAAYEYASNAIEHTIESAEKLTDEAKNVASIAIDDIKEQSTGFWGAASGLTYFASFFAVPTALVFGGTVLLGAGVTMIANSLKDSIPKEDNK